MINYFSFPYSLIKDKEALMKELSRIRAILEIEMDLDVFSPLHHSHSFNEDLITKPPHEHWLIKDLKILEGFMNHDGYIGAALNCKTCNKTYVLNDIGQAVPDCKCKPIHSHVCDKIIYDSGVIMLLPQTAFDTSLYDYNKILPNPKLYEELKGEIWKSDGCRIVYERCKEKHIRVLDLDAFLEGREDDI